MQDTQEGDGKPADTQVKVKAITKIKNGSIISLFNKTPKPRKLSDVHCPHFWELKYANGCKYDCQWCYLNGTFRYFTWGKAPRLKDERMTVKHITEALTKIEEQTLFNAGEVSDGLVFTGTMSNHIIPLFRDERTNPYNHKLLILTKSNDMRVMAHANATQNVIFAYSLNASVVSGEWELHAPTPRERLQAARKAHEYNYEVRLRIDPMVPIKRWDRHYKALIDDIMDICPWASVITLGSLRGLNSTITACKKRGNDVSWKDYLTDTTNWGLRVPEHTRVEMYSFAITYLRQKGYEGEIAICKESKGVWKHLKLNPNETKCNCML